jgi:hypothetical protein
MKRETEKEEAHSYSFREELCRCVATLVSAFESDTLRDACVATAHLNCLGSVVE